MKLGVLKRFFVFFLSFCMIAGGMGGTVFAEENGLMESFDFAVTEGKRIEGAEYVLIYNPVFFNESDAQDTSSRYTGDFSNQIEVGIQRADGPEIEIEQTSIGQNEWEDLFGTVEVQESGRAPGIPEIFQVGDKSSFYYYSSLRFNTRLQVEFRCVYAGTSCYIWSLEDAISEDKAFQYGRAFDENIYDQDVKEFGPARFTEDGGKVNILFYPMDQEGILGFFYNGDIFASGEVSPLEVISYGLNTDRAIINLNSGFIKEGYDEKILSTLSHEFQHLIVASDRMESKSHNMMNTWFNEAMSAYAEEFIYPGSKVRGNYNLLIYMSPNFQHGQSLYNFSTTNDSYIGAYGAVYLYEEFLRDLCGNDIFSKVHRIWRNVSDPSYTTIDAIAEAVPDEVRLQVEQEIQYPESISTGLSPNEVFMSKLTLRFYLETLRKELASLDEAAFDPRPYMVYDSVNGANLEGGGRIVVATRDGSYTIPKDSDPGLIYVGLDADFNVVSGMITSGEKKDLDSSDTFSSLICIPSSDAEVENYAETILQDVYTKAGLPKSEIYYASSPTADMIVLMDTESRNNPDFITMILPDDISDQDWIALQYAAILAEGAGSTVAVIANKEIDRDICAFSIVLDYSASGHSIYEVMQYFGTDLAEAFAGDFLAAKEGTLKKPSIWVIE